MSNELFKKIMNRIHEIRPREVSEYQAYQELCRKLIPEEFGVTFDDFLSELHRHIYEDFPRGSGSRLVEIDENNHPKIGCVPKY